MRIWIVLCGWLTAVIFPLAWLGAFSPAYRQAFNTVFGSQWVHIVMHTLQFAVLGVLTALAFRLPLNPRTVLIVALVFLGVGVLEEGFQMLSQSVEPEHIGVLAAAAFDLGVDLAGGLLGLAGLALCKTLRRDNLNLG